MKEDTRIDGPWKDDDEKEAYIPRQLRVLFDDDKFVWRPFQETILNSFDEFETRKINILVDEQGNIGKSIIKTTCGVYKKALTIPMINDYKDVMRMVMDAPKWGGYIIDMPRAIKKDRLFQIFSALEHVKDGYAFDDRYNFRYEYFDSPVIWIFTNRVPETEMLSTDRWCVWRVDDEHLLVPEEGR